MKGRSFHDAWTDGRRCLHRSKTDPYQWGGIWGGEVDAACEMPSPEKELVDPFRNGAGSWPQGRREPVLIHDLGRASPYGVDDLAANEAWVCRRRVKTEHSPPAET